MHSHACIRPDAFQLFGISVAYVLELSSVTCHDSIRGRGRAVFRHSIMPIADGG